MAIYDLTQNIPTDIAAGDILNCPYSGTYKTINLPKGTYKLEVWGAQGGTYSSSYVGGKGGYSVGTVILTEKSTNVYLYTGGQGSKLSTTSTKAGGGYNGGGKAYTSSSSYYSCGGGGASDIRIGSTSLYARVIVAGGGGGAHGAISGYGNGGYGGGTSGQQGVSSSSTYTGGVGGSQTAAGTSYYGTTADNTSYGDLATFGSGGNGGASYSCGGGGGWYGGGYARRAGAGGGSGYIYTSSTASNYPSGCLLNSSMYLTDANTIAGNASMPSTSGSTETGHSGDGYVRITVISVDSGLPIKMKVNGEIVEASAGYVKIDGNWKEINSIYTKKNGEWIN